MKACVLVDGAGDYTHLKIENVQDPKDVGDTEVLIRHSAIGVNFDDIMYRKGDYIIPKEFGKKPILGFEAVGTILRLGSKVKGFKIGDQVGYAFCRIGAYAEQNVVDYRYVCKIPDSITPEIAAGVLRKGLTAQYLLLRTCALAKNDTVLIHSIAGGVGYMLAKLAKHMGLRVIGTICCEEKMSFALSTGVDCLIDRSKGDMLKKIADFTEGQGVATVYDGIGDSVFDESLNALKPFGVYVSYGYAGGKLGPFDAFRLRDRNLFFTTPTLEMYMANRYALLLSVADLFDVVKKDIITPKITHYRFEEIPQAHADMESGKSTGSLIVDV